MAHNCQSNVILLQKILRPLRVFAITLTKSWVVPSFAMRRCRPSQCTRRDMLAFLSFVSLGLTASASAIAKRAGVSCETIHTGTLRLFSVNQTDTTLDPAGVNVSFASTGATPSFIIAGGPSTQFTFEQCNSSFMGYTPYNGGPILNYGHLSPVGQPAPIGAPKGAAGCLTVPLGSSSGSPFLVFNDACEQADDDSQLLDYWGMINDTTTGRVSVNFVGSTENGTTYNNNQYTAWLLEVDEFETEPAIKLAGYIGPTPISYQLRFVD
ncbi:hypothetical protein B0H21DRAFT_117047 [Amylocystis lapponica]|nr:hypothetical protein B0H21DRAFT_117047 [Amylocystis lapponica]